MPCPKKWAVPAGHQLVCEGHLALLRSASGGGVNFSPEIAISTHLKCKSCGLPVLLLPSPVLQCMTALSSLGNGVEGQS